MRRAVLASAVLTGLCGPAAAQQWIPPRPGQSICSGWTTTDARQGCEAKEETQRAAAEAARQAEKARTQAQIEAAIAEQRARAAAIRTRTETEEAAAREAATRIIPPSAAEIAAIEERQRAAEAAARANREYAQTREKAAFDQAEAAYAARQQAFARAEAADDFKRKDVQDAFVAPEAFTGQKIKLGGMFCYAPRDNDVRCWTPEAEVVVFATSIEPPEAAAALREQCATVRDASTTACLRVLRFVMGDYRRDRENGGSDRVVISPSVLTVAR